MNEMRMLFVVLIPFITGILISVMKFRSRKNMLLFTEVMAILNSILVFLLLLYRPEGALTVFRFTGNLSIRLQLDGMGALFAGMSAILWPFALLYAFEYMKGEKHIVSYGIFYDGESFLVCIPLRKSRTFCYRDIRSQQLYAVTGGNVIVELHMENGETVSVGSHMDGVYPFLDTAFAGWCLQTGRDPQSCTFHDPSQSCWFPGVEEP